MQIGDSPRQLNGSETIDSHGWLSQLNAWCGLVNGHNNFRCLSWLRWSVGKAKTVTNSYSKSECAFALRVNLKRASQVGVITVAEPLLTTILSHEQFHRTDSGWTNVFYLVVNIEHVSIHQLLIADGG